MAEVIGGYQDSVHIANFGIHDLGVAEHLIIVPC